VTDDRAGPDRSSGAAAGHAPSMTVGVIGPGRVGTALAVALSEAGHAVVAVAGRPGGDPPSTSLERFTAAVPAARVVVAADVPAAADVVLVTVADDVLADVLRGLAAADVVRPGGRWLHTSGRHGLRVLRPVALAGARVAACHPAQTFPTPEAGRAALPGTAWAVTATGADRTWAHQLVAAVGGVPVDVRDVDRVRYHAALAVGSNGTTAVVALARDLLLSVGITDPELFLAPLVRASAVNAAAHGAAALTGPVRRGDAGTVHAHLNELRATMPETVPAYRALARLALSYARRAGLDDARARMITEILDAE
jgi:predicted short-subunit dehydrogenase-like oxidoreductase (DUF2520 family)